MTPPIRIRSFKPVRKNSLHTFAIVELPLGTLIADVVIGHSHVGRVLKLLQPPFRRKRRWHPPRRTG